MTPPVSSRQKHGEKVRSNRAAPRWAPARESAGARTVVVVSADAGLWQRLGERLTAMNWRVRGANGGAQAMLYLQAESCEAMLVDNWLPDLLVGEFAEQAGLMYPAMQVLAIDPRAAALSGPKAGGLSLLRQDLRDELIYAMRAAQDVALATLAVRREDGPAGDDGARARRLEAYRVRPDGSVTDGTVRRDAAARRSGAVDDGASWENAKWSSRDLQADLAAESAPLRQRLEEIPALAEHFLERMGRVSPRKRLSSGAAERLQQHDWPGNVRELMHVLERGVVLAGAKAEIAMEDIRYRQAQRS